MGVVLFPGESVVNQSHKCRPPVRSAWSDVPVYGFGTIWKCDKCDLHWRVEGRKWRKLNKRQNRILDRRAEKELAHQSD